MGGAGKERFESDRERDNGGAKMRERSREGVVHTLTCDAVLENVLRFFWASSIFPQRLYVFSGQ